MRIGARLAALGASILIAGAVAVPSAAAQTNTFNVNCTNVTIAAQWNPPITLTPQPAVLSGTLSGGSCSGTVNGESFSNQPMTGTATIPGVHSCELGEGQGHGAFRIDGRNLYASVTYRRGGHDGAILFQGDSGGQGVLRLHGDFGLISDSNPLATFIPEIAGPVDAATLLAVCATPQGLSSLTVIADSFTSVPTISSPAQE
jgi:hypothetical protein